MFPLAFAYSGRYVTWNGGLPHLPPHVQAPGPEVRHGNSTRGQSASSGVPFCTGAGLELLHGVISTRGPCVCTLPQFPSVSSPGRRRPTRVARVAIRRVVAGAAQGTVQRVPSRVPLPRGGEPCQCPPPRKCWLRAGFRPLRLLFDSIPGKPVLVPTFRHCSTRRHHEPTHGIDTLPDDTRLPIRIGSIQSGDAIVAEMSDFIPWLRNGRYGARVSLYAFLSTPRRHKLPMQGYNARQSGMRSVPVYAQRRSVNVVGRCHPGPRFSVSDPGLGQSGKRPGLYPLDVSALLPGASGCQPANHL